LNRTRTWKTCKSVSKGNAKRRRDGSPARGATEKYCQEKGYGKRGGGPCKVSWGRKEKTRKSDQAFISERCRFKTCETLSAARATNASTTQLKKEAVLTARKPSKSSCFVAKRRGRCQPAARWRRLRRGPGEGGKRGSGERRGKVTRTLGDRVGKKEQ